MPSPLRPEQRRFPLHVHISVMFTFLLLLTGVVLGLFNYRQTTQIILSSSEKLFNRIEQDVRLDLQATYAPIRHLLSLLADNPAARSSGLEPRLALLKPFSQSLTDNPDLASLYLGYGNGDFFMVRPLRTPALKTLLKAPDAAAFQVWSIEHDASGQAHSQSLFFDQALSPVGRQDNPDDPYDPRSRAWYINARQQTEQITTEPYVFFSTHNVGTTLARRSGDDAVIGADLTLDALSATLIKHVVTPATEIVLFDADGNAVAYPDSSRLIVDDRTARLAKAADLSPALNALLSGHQGNRLKADGRLWIVARSQLQEGGPKGLQMALLVPEDELLVDAYRMRWQGALITLATLLLCLPLGWLISRILVKPLHALVKEADAIRSFDFNFPVTRRSLVLEIDQLSLSMARMKDTLASFFRITDSLTAETRFEPLLQRALFETVQIAQAQAGLIYLRENDGNRMEPYGLVVDGASQALTAFDIQGRNLDATQGPEWFRQLASADTVVSNLGFEQATDLRKVLLAMASPRVHLIGIRLHNRHNETVGLLVLLINDSGTASDLEKLRPDRIAFLQAVSGAAAVSIESQRLQARQKQLLDAFIQLLAGAIDAKSPYTGGHCQRVPELTLMLAQAAAASQAPAFSAYQPNEDEWEALHIAAWLHDCGKVTTPEYVVDKATKLETLNDRLHEIRTRFEVLKRDAWVSYWQALAMGGEERQLADLRDATLTALDDDFAFVAHCNLGSEAMAEADLQRLQGIARRTWTRTLDDRLGLSWEENRRQARTPAPPLPVTEPLLADKPEHLLERAEGELIPENNPWGFKLDVPPYKYNRGELYNLSIPRGTLTREERYIINHHMVQTILMLSHLPFPGHLNSVAEIAGGHHEKMDGTGYPKRLKREDMSLPARMIAIADIFEALTAADRPYKKAKSLSEALGIMATMCREAHIDAELFELFIRDGVYLQYATRFLDPRQIDAVDPAAVLLKAGLAA
ncbi:HD domain-containing protein [Pseudomonas fluorescens]|uniref:Putative chemotaxis protein n=1 Tax=Pseudomonas fluorescens (strain Pf0-1) TaxID=205922 RepID=Q3K941_PSEPF|nr:HD domain-containing phosphohydrolase [Pseudomonas fluorescens]ABA75713.1 putative chemotaxis protein [Pseudomonas fluorescens Pf0-1]MBY9025295.1 HD domain-containing protein [Pseudomonas fluorescens]MBY9031851.1 HD domain-containing protein [Pseudomonas fluorescens]MBY9037309.1 HD domain-containing protein [Pseudomonas fluorescens]MBY9043497.1 HD domain-containing protein [Pseudomonas fluorescens]